MPKNTPTSAPIKAVVQQLESAVQISFVIVLEEDQVWLSGGQLRLQAWTVLDTLVPLLRDQISQLQASSEVVIVAVKALSNSAAGAIQFLSILSSDRTKRGREIQTCVGRHSC